MSDTGSIRSSRASTSLGRTHIAPLGPRTRQSSRISNITTGDTTTSTLSTPPDIVDSQEPGSASTSTNSPSIPTSSPRSLNFEERKSLPAVSEEAPTPASTAPVYDLEATSSSPSPQVPSVNPVKVTPAPTPPPRIIAPEAIKFETSTIPWKGLPLEATLWTVDSHELQSIVSRAIRSSAQESFIRLLTVDNLDTILPAELERLENLKVVTQSKYRFLVHRRTMLFQALNSSSASQKHKDADDPAVVVSRLAAQMAETVAKCEKQLQELFIINDQIGQINKLIDVHWASALAIALRKLNASYARRTADLTTSKGRVKQLEAELEQAWKEAERVARELDEYEAAITADDEEAIIEAAEIISIPKTPPLTRRSSVPMTPTIYSVTPVTQPSTSTTPQSPLSPTSPSFQTGFVPQVHLKAKETEAEDVPDTVSIRSGRSTRSGRSYRSGKESNHIAAVHAAKKRHSRASESSLHLNIGHYRKHSGRVNIPYEDQPPLPELPLQFAGRIMSASPANASSTILQLDASISPKLRRQASLDTILTGGRSPYSQPRRAADDLYLRPRSNASEEIQLVMRTPPANRVNFPSIYLAEQGPRPPPKDPSKSIPSMWMNADAILGKSPPPPPATHVSAVVLPAPAPTPSAVSSLPALPENSKSNRKLSISVPKNKTMGKLRTLTKRYSVSLPMFVPKITRPTSRRSD